MAHRTFANRKKYNTFSILLINLLLLFFFLEGVLSPVDLAKMDTNLWMVHPQPPPVFCGFDCSIREPFFPLEFELDLSQIRPVLDHPLKFRLLDPREQDSGCSLITVVTNFFQSLEWS